MPDEELLDSEELKLPAEVQARLRIGRKAERDAANANAEIASLKLQSAIRDAGVPNHPARDVVFKDYDGPLEPDAIKAHAEKFGIVAETVSDGPTDQEIQAQRQILNAGGGAPAANGDIDAGVAMRNATEPKDVWAVIDQVGGTPGFKNHDGLIGVRAEY